jgi:hypothetical protein
MASSWSHSWIIHLLPHSSINMPRPRSSPLAVWVGDDVYADLDDVQQGYIGCSRHLLAIAALQAGLEVFRETPERLLEILVARPKGKEVGVKPK